jgi:hypothetical protein
MLKNHERITLGLRDQADDAAVWNSPSEQRARADLQGNIAPRRGGSQHR